ncbi:MAG: hypothetical protein Q4E69_01920 [Bacilli bacterium]|nr:hypothetical protein [Bacilli bacterium]
MIIIIGILIALASWVANSVGGIVFGLVVLVVGLVASKKEDPIEQTIQSNKSKEEKMKKVMTKYDYERFTTILRKNLTEDEFRYIEEGLNFVSEYTCTTGIRILLDGVQTCKRTFYYADYNVNFSGKKLEELTTYIETLAAQYLTTEKETIHKNKVVHTVITKHEVHYFEDKGGHLQSSLDSGSDEIFKGYRVYITGKKVKDTSLKEW